jgi:hypothetical protein
MTSRRRFLQALGLGGSSLWLPSLGCDAHDDDGPGPQRLLMFFTVHGTIYEQWKMHPPGMSSGQRWSASLRELGASDFSPILRPLHRFRDRMSVYDGLALVSAETERNNVRHIIGGLHALTGAPTAIVSTTAVGSAPSIDQRIADMIARPDQFRSIEVAVGEPIWEVITRDARQVLPLQTDPLLLHQQLFGGGDAELTAAAQASVFATAGTWYDDFARDLPAEDRTRVEIHRQLLRDLEIRAQGLSAAVCEQPSMPGMSAMPATSSGGYSERFDDFRRLLTTAFACDLTRVATFYMSTQPGERVGPNLQSDMHQAYAHNVYVDAAAAAAMTDYGRRHAEDLALVLEALDAIPDRNGSLLDNTTVVWCGELADGAHGYERWPVVVIGGRNLRQGNYEHWPSNTPYAGYRWDGTRSSSMGVPHEKFLTTLARSFGLDIDHMPTTEIIGIDGARIDCTGLLDGMLP